MTPWQQKYYIIATVTAEWITAICMMVLVGMLIWYVDAAAWRQGPYDQKIECFGMECLW